MTGGPDVRHIEGRNPVLEALRAGVPLREVLVAEGVRPAAVLEEIRALAARAGVPVRGVPRRDLERRSRSRSPQGVIAVAPGFSYAGLDDVLGLASSRREPPLLLALDGVTDPQNLGAVARSAEAAGAHGLLLPGRRSAQITPAAEKAAAGALAHLPVVRAGNLASSLDLLGRAGVWIAALDAAGTTALWDLHLATEPFCLVVGAEGKGVSRLVRERADVLVRIPMAGAVSSLSASAAGAVALFEVARLRTARVG